LGSGIHEALDKFEHRDPCLGLRLEPAPVEKLAFERGEEALAHGVVVGVSDRAHRGAHASFAGSDAELNQGVLRALVGVVDYALRWPHRERHVQGVEHQPGGEGRGHRPADDPAAARIEHDCQVEKAGPSWNVGVIGRFISLGAVRL
jgi:hypothetical protein